jgi:hypothetical protein
MKAYRDLEGKILCQDGDRVARVETELPEELASPSMVKGFVPWVFTQPDESKRPIFCNQAAFNTTKLYAHKQTKK